jgi:hypothetical protein
MFLLGLIRQNCLALSSIVRRRLVAEKCRGGAEQAAVVERLHDGHVRGTSCVVRTRREK